MRVKIGNYPNWIGPYQVADKIFFWIEKYPEMLPNGKLLENRWDYKLHDWFGEFLAHGFHKETPEQKMNWTRKDRPITWFYKLCNWVHSKKKRKVDIKLDRWDTWNVDATVSILVLPLLKQLRESKHGSGFIELEDVPEHLRFTETEEYDEQYCFDFYHEDGVKKLDVDVHTRYEWFLDELIWTFEQLQPDYEWEDQYRSGDIDLISVPCQRDENGKPTMYTMARGPNYTYVVDEEGRSKHQARIDNGLRLFGKYYQTLWD